MTEKPSLPAKRSTPSNHSGDALWPEDLRDPLQQPALFEGVVARRVVAYILDSVVIGVLGLVSWMVLGMMTALTFGLASPLLILLIILPLVYHSLTIGYLGATPGMRFFDIEVRMLSGERPDVPQALILTVVFYATVWLTASLVLLVALFNQRQRCLHDILLGVLVVRSSVLHPRQL